MKKIAEVIGKELEWVQPSAWKMEYELHAGSELSQLSALGVHLVRSPQRKAQMAAGHSSGSDSGRPE